MTWHVCLRILYPEMMLNVRIKALLLVVESQDQIYQISMLVTIPLNFREDYTITFYERLLLKALSFGC